MREKGLIIVLLFIVSSLSSPIVKNSHGFSNNYEITTLSNSEQITHADFFGLLIDQINDFWLSNDGYEKLPFYTAACDIAVNAPYWPNNANWSRKSLSKNGQAHLVVNSETVENGSLVLFSENYLTIPDHSLPSYQLFGSVSILNESTSVTTFYYSEGTTSVGTLEKYINASINTLFVREIEGSITAGLYGVEPNSHAAVQNIRDSLKWLSYSFNTTLIEEIIQKEIDNLIDYEFTNWLTKTTFGLLCLDAGNYFSNSTLTSYGFALLDEIYSSDNYLDDEDFFYGWKYDLALELMNYNQTFAKEITDFCISLLFDDLGEEFLQPLAASTESYQFLAGNPGKNYLVTNRYYYSFVNLLLNMHTVYPLDNYNSIIQKIMNYFYTLLYYDPINDIYNPDVEFNFSLDETLQYSTYKGESRTGFIFQFARIISQLLDGLNSLNDSEPPTVTLSQDYWLIDDINYSVNLFEMTDELSGIRNFKVYNETHQLESIYHSPSLTEPFYFSKQTSHDTIKLTYDSIHCYFFFPETLQTETTYTFVVYDKIGNSLNVAITFYPESTIAAGISIEQLILLLPVIIINIAAVKKRIKNSRKNSK